MLPTPAKRRLLYLDGLRGLTALMIVLTHVYWEICPGGDAGELPRWLAFALQPFAFAGKVSIFIALSGYCQMLWVVERKEPFDNRGIRELFRRRALRLLPPYYAVLLFCFVLLALFPALREPGNGRWDIALPALCADAILPHLFLIHNLSPAWLYRIDPPLWTMAVEAQLLLFFSLLLLPIYRRYGRLALLTTGFVLSFLPLATLPKEQNLFWSCPWFLLVFCLGMLGATWKNHPKQVRLTRYLTFVLAFPMLAQVLVGDTWHRTHPILADLLTGTFVVCLLVSSTEAATAGAPSRAVRFLEAAPLVWLGQMSYSLYLIHFPLLSLCHIELRHLCPSLTAAAQLGLLFLTGVPLALGAARLFHRSHRTRFLSARG